MSKFKFDKENDLIVDLNEGTDFAFGKDYIIQDDDVLYSYEKGNGKIIHLLKMDKENICSDHQNIIEHIKEFGVNPKDIMKNPQLILDAIYKECGDEMYEYECFDSIFAFVDGIKLQTSSSIVDNRYSCFDVLDGRFPGSSDEFHYYLEKWVRVWGNDIGGKIASHYTSFGGSSDPFSFVPYFDEETKKNLYDIFYKSCAEHDKRILQKVATGDGLIIQDCA